MLFDPLCMRQLRKLVRRSGARIVLCSSWRDAFGMPDPESRELVETLYRRLARNGTPLCDAVPRLPSGDKGEEIASWLEDHPCGRFVILDDHDCFSPASGVREYWIPIRGDRGLTGREARLAIRLLAEGGGIPDTRRVLFHAQQ